MTTRSTATFILWCRASLSHSKDRGTSARPSRTETRSSDNKSGSRDFCATFYAEVLGELGVTAVVRLNEPQYDRRLFGDRGIAVHDLEFEDCTAPPDDVVEAFLRVADEASGAMAVHCKAGLWRTGTLIAVYLMRRHGFTAREVMGWMRIMRPGSVIGEQQHFLCSLEEEEEHHAQTPRPQPASSDGTAGRAPSALLAVQVAAGMERRGAARAKTEGRQRAC